MSDLPLRRSGTAMLMGIVVLAAYVSGAIAPLLEYPTELTADVLAMCLELVGFDAIRQSEVIFHQADFAYEIYFRCIGALPAAALAIGIYASPARRFDKLVGLVIGIPVLIVFNLVRLVHLFGVGVNAPERFWLTHSVIWESATVGMTLLVWGVWLYCSYQHDTEEPADVLPVKSDVSSTC